MAGDTPEEIARFGTFLEEAARYFEGRPTNGEDAAHWSNVTNAETCRRIAAVLTAERARADKLQKSFNLRWQATQRAIKRWQEAHPGNDLTWPDSADLTVWLLEQLTAERADREKAEAERDAMSNVMGRMLGARFLDPPDGGDVPLPEQVRRLCEALLKAEAERAVARAAALREAAEVVAALPLDHEYLWADPRRPFLRASRAILALIDKEPGHE